MDQSFYTQFDELPLTLCATDIAAILNISRSNAYMLLRREDFPTLHIGKRMLTPKHRFIQWIEENTKWACFLRQRTRWMQELLFSWFQPKGSLSRAALPKEHTPICLLPTATYRRTFLCFNVFLILAFGFIRDSHFDSARFQQRLQISLSKMLSVFKPQICHHFFPGPFFRTVCDQGFFFFIMRGNMHVVMRGIKSLQSNAG